MSNPLNDQLKILVFLDHDIMIRHFIRSGTFEPIMYAHDVRFLFPQPGYKNNSRVSIDPKSLGLGERVGHLTVHQERLRLWTKLSHVSRMRWKPGLHHATMRNLIRTSIGPGHIREYSILALPGIYHVFLWRTLSALKALPNESLEDILDCERPDLIVHPTVLFGPYMHDLSEATARRKIPFVAIMNSWDNPTSKSNMYLKPEWLLVWGEQTKAHARRYLKMDPEKVVVFGAAQFEVYRDPPRITREEFCQRHGLDPRKALLLYAGSSKDTDEFRHLSMLDAAIEAGELGNTVVVYRPHPWGGGGKDGGRIIDHEWRHVVVEDSMRDYLVAVRDKGYSASHPDYRITRDVLTSIDALITPLSTIILEAALLGKPPLCFLPIDDDAEHFRLSQPLVHFKEIYEMPEFLVAKGSGELVEQTSALLARVGDRAFAERLRASTHFFVGPFDEPYGERLVKFVESIARH